jgi:hypothetical protein
MVVTTLFSSVFKDNSIIFFIFNGIMAIMVEYGLKLRVGVECRNL